MEGPSIVILVEECAKFLGQKVIRSSGSSQLINIGSLRGQRLLGLKSWGKHFIMQFERTNLKIHFMLFGSYTIDKPKPEREPRLAFKFRTGELFTYACSVREIESPLNKLYDWRVDVMARDWDETLVLKKLKALGDMLICDALLQQDIFAGAGNIFKNEVLFRVGLRPETKLSTLRESELKLLVREVRLYAYQFLTWKKQFLLRKNWVVYKRKFCAVCETKTVMKTTGNLQRRSHYCPKCQVLRTKVPKKTVDAAVSERLKSISRQIGELGELGNNLPTLDTQGGVEKER
jgi:endonuclease-8